MKQAPHSIPCSIPYSIAGITPGDLWLFVWRKETLHAEFVVSTEHLDDELGRGCWVLTISDLEEQYPNPIAVQYPQEVLRVSE